jgi:hypothetical protein
MNNDYNTAEEEYAQILQEIADEFEIDTTLLHDLIEYEHSKVHLTKRRGARNDIRQIIEQWIESQPS